MQLPVLPVILLVLGALIVAGSFIFAVLNLIASRKGRSKFRNHGLAVLGILIGGFIAVAGAYAGGWSIFNQLLQRLGS